MIFSILSLISLYFLSGHLDCHLLLYYTKVLEAMLHGAVVVTTPVGVEGIASNTSFPGYVVERGAEDAETYIWKGGCRIAVATGTYVVRWS